MNRFWDHYRTQPPCSVHGNLECLTSNPGTTERHMTRDTGCTLGSGVICALQQRRVVGASSHFADWASFLRMSWDSRNAVIRTNQPWNFQNSACIATFFHHLSSEKNWRKHCLLSGPSPLSGITRISRSPDSFFKECVCSGASPGIRSSLVDEDSIAFEFWNWTGSNPAFTTSWIYDFRGLRRCCHGKEPNCQCRRQKRCRCDPWVKKIP